MRQLLIPFFLFLLFFDLSGQTRLEPADSTENQDWFKEHPTSFLVYGSGLRFPSVFDLGYQGLRGHLDEQGFKKSRISGQLVVGFGIRLKRFWLDIQTSLDSGNNEEFVNGNTVVSFHEDLFQGELALGYILYSNSYLSIVPRMGIGLSEYTFQYNTHDNDETFDFNDPGSLNTISSPRLIHDNVYLGVGLDIMNGLQGKSVVFLGGRIGYRRGLHRSNWYSNYGTVIPALSDRMEQLYISILLGFSVELKKKQ